MLCVIRIEVFRFDRDISICHEIFRCWQIIVAISKAHEHLAESQALLDDVQELQRKFLVLRTNRQECFNFISYETHIV